MKIDRIRGCDSIGGDPKVNILKINLFLKPFMAFKVRL